MKQICLFCQRQAADQNLFCPEPDCSAEQAPFIFEAGEWFEDFEILRRIALSRTGVLYKARQQEKDVLLKIAHPGKDNLERLKRETLFLHQFVDPESPFTYLPQLQRPYLGTDIESDPCGRSMIDESQVYFSVWSYCEGEPLSQLLLQRNHLWINYVGWIVIQVADAIQLMHDDRKLHLSLSPESLLIRFDKKKCPRILLWDLGLLWDMDKVAVDHENFSLQEEAFTCLKPRYASPAYLPPELSTTAPLLTAAADIYGIGTVFFEMLVGKPIYAHALRSDAEIEKTIQSGRRHRIHHGVDTEHVTKLIQKMIEPSPQVRQQSIDQLLEDLETPSAAEEPPLFVRLPAEERNRRLALPNVSPAMLWVWIIALLVIVVIIFMAVRAS
ncbi:MAG: protein kinase [Anaerolineae bacterium]|nr:protein kinase [Anaerolineae bacterium]